MTTPKRANEFPPNLLSDDAIQTARPDELEAAIRRHEQYAKGLAREDPGRGLPRPEAQAARERQLREVNRHAAEVERLRAALGPDPDSDEVRKQRREAAHAGHRPPGQPLSATDPAMQQFYIDKHHASEEKRMAREQKRQEAEDADRAEHPPDPRAVSIAAAVLADDVLIDFLEVKPTKTSLGDVQTISALEVVDVAVLGVTLRLLEERRPLAFRELGQGGKWPQRTPPIASTRGLGESL